MLVSFCRTVMSVHRQLVSPGTVACSWLAAVRTHTSAVRRSNFTAAPGVRPRVTQPQAASRSHFSADWNSWASAGYSSTAAHRMATIIDSDFLSPGSNHHKRLFMVLLNYRLPRGIQSLWSYAKLRICADGGANRLYDQLPAWQPELNADSVRQQYVPDLIKGDLDSVRPEVRHFYSSQGVPVTDLSEDQDTTDLTKCISFLEQQLMGPDAALDSHVILVAGALGGRLDHTLSHLNCLYSFPHLNIVLWGEGNLARLCRAGKTIIRPHPLEGPTCGLIPLGPPVTATSSGLKWNLDNTVMQVKGLLSTSNVLQAPEVVVEADGDMIWTTEVPQALLDPREQAMRREAAAAAPAPELGSPDSTEAVHVEAPVTV